MCDKRLRSSPPYEGGQGDVDSEGPVVAQKNIANGTSPYPLHKGDSLLLVIQRSVATKNLENTAQPYPLRKGDL